MAYKKELKLSDFSSSALSDIKDFTEELLSLYEVYGSDIKIPVAYPPVAEEVYNDLFTGVSATAINYFTRPIQRTQSVIKGKYQDEALLKRSEQTRLNKIILLRKLGCIQSVHINTEQPLAEREATLYVSDEKLLNLFNAIEKRLKQEEVEESKQKIKENKIYYDEAKSAIILGEKTIFVSGWEDAVCKIFFNPKNKSEEIEIGDVIDEMMGIAYLPSEKGERKESARQSVYRLNKKIKKEFEKEDYFRYSTRNHKITKNK